MHRTAPRAAGSPRLALSLLLLVVPLTAASTEAVVTVTGEGRVSAPPDSAAFRTGASLTRPTARAALAESNAVIAAVKSGLEERGIAAEKIQTVQFSVAPQYAPRTRGDEEPPRVVGYRVVHALAVRVDDPSTLGRVLDEAIARGANLLDSIELTNRDPAPLLDEARRRAVRDAVRRAGVLAQAAGRTLGPVRAIQESGGGLPPVRPLARTADVQGFAAVPIATGENELTLNVTIEFALE